jgi:hypothetical protein
MPDMVAWVAILGGQIHAGDFVGMTLIALGLTAIDGRLLAWFKLRPLSAATDELAILRLRHGTIVVS